MQLNRLHRIIINWKLYILLALAVGCSALFIPFIATVHIDSALVSGVIGAFAASWIASHYKSKDQDVFKLTGLIYIAAVPLLIRDLFTGCISSDGIAYWLFIPSFSVLFGFSLGRAMRFLFPGYARWVAITGIVVFAAGGWITVFFMYPQLYYFNHIFGYWPGPIYDESVAFTDRLVRFRIITLTWIAIFWMIPHLRGSERIVKIIFLLLVLFLGTLYAQSARYGVYSPVSQIRTVLGGVYQTEYFDIYYSGKHYHPDEMEFIGYLHEFHLSELTDTLQITWPKDKKIESYLYGHAWQMQELTGAKGVSFVPTWLGSAQLHMHKTAIDRTLRHELVHVIARSFGNRLLNASWNIGMVEGLAVALSPASAMRLTADQLVLSNDALLTEDEIRSLFTLSGFYRRSSSVAYSVSGSFVSSLLKHYPVDYYKSAYRYSSLERGYGDLLGPAVDFWHKEMEQVDVTDDERKTAEQIFAIPSIFDINCPRKITKSEACRDAAARLEAENDTPGFFGISKREYLQKVLQEITESPIDRDRFEEYRKAIYLLALDLADSQGYVSGLDNFPVTDLYLKLSDFEWRPVRQIRLEEAYRFAMFMHERSQRN